MEEIALSWERERDFRRGGSVHEDSGGSGADCDIVSDEHFASGDEMEAAMDSPMADITLFGVGGPYADSGCGAFACCCSHIARLLGSTGQLEAVSGLFDGRGVDSCGGEGTRGADAGEEASAGGSAFHHPIISSWVLDDLCTSVDLIVASCPALDSGWSTP